MKTGLPSPHYDHDRHRGLDYDSKLFKFYNFEIFLSVSHYKLQLLLVSSDIMQLQGAVKCDQKGVIRCDLSSKGSNI